MLPHGHEGKKVGASFGLSDTQDVKHSMIMAGVSGLLRIRGLVAV